MAAPNTYLRQNIYKIPKGRPAFSRRLADGSYEGYRFFGNCPQFDLEVETENYQHPNSEGGLEVIDLDVPIRVTRTSNIAVDNLSIDNLAVWLSAGVSDFTQNTVAVVGEAISVRADRTYQLGEVQNPSGVRNVGSVVATVGGTTRANEVAVTRGQILLPATPNDHAYLVTVSGITDDTPPTFPTNGGTVVDGTATLLDLGIITSLVAGTDYVVDGPLGLISTPVAGKIGAAAAKAVNALGADATNWTGLPILVDYTPGANTRKQIRAGEATTTLRGKLKFFADNPYGEDQDVLIPECTIGPSGPLPFIGAGEAASITFTVGIGILNNQTPPVIIENRGS